MHKQNKMVGALTFTALLFASHLAIAESNPVREIERMNQEISVLTKKQELLDTQQKYADTLKKGAATDINTPPPKVKAVEGFGGKQYATCITSGGASVTRTIGDEVVGGWKVASIKDREVVFVRGKISARVPVMFEANSAATFGPMQMPSMPPRLQ